MFPGVQTARAPLRTARIVQRLPHYCPIGGPRTPIRTRLYRAGHANELAEAERFINSLLAQPDMHALDEALAALTADDLRTIVRRLIMDIGPVNRWT